MARLPGHTEWIAELIPALESRVDQFTVDTDEVDDELMEVFLDELRRLTADLLAGVSNDDSDLIRSAAHSIKGMGGTIGLPELSVLALEIENLAKEERVADTAGMVNALSEWMKNAE